jgi:RND family efflux transporter MFP subunit
MRALPVFVFPLLACAVACGRSAPAGRDAAVEEAVPVVAQLAATGSLRAVLHASGVITPAQGAEFLAIAPEPARIQEITRAMGDAVAPGDVLVRFALPSAAENLARAIDEVARAQAQVENARIAQNRTRDFVDRGLIARRELDAVDRELEEAQSELARAEANRKLAEATAAQAVIRAPFAGVVAQRFKNSGDLALAVPTDPVLRIIDPKRIEVTALVPQGEAPRVLVGTTARLAGAGDDPVRLTVATVNAPGATAPAGMTAVRLTFLDVPQVAVDTPVEVDIDAEERANVVFVPPDAIVGSGASAAVYVAAGDRAQRRAVTIGISTEERVEIRSGVQAGELVITRGHANLPDGALVSVDTGAR